MNNEIAPFSSSRYPDTIIIQIWTKQEDETYSKLDTIRDFNEDKTAIVYLDSMSDETNYENDDDTGANIMEYKLTLEYPMSMELGDLQYVMETSSGGEFIYANNKGGVGCDGRRAFGRRKTEIFLEIDSSSKTFQDDDETNSSNQQNREKGEFVEGEAGGSTVKGGVEVWAGWATGHEAVTLTPRVRFQFRDENVVESDLTQGEENLVEQIALDKSLSSVDQDTELNRHMDELLAEQKKIAMERMHQMRDSVVMKHDHERIKNIQMGSAPGKGKSVHDYYEDNKSFEEGERGMNHFLPSKSNDKKSRHHNLREKHKNLEDDLAFSLQGFFKGCSFLILAIICIIGFLMFFQKRSRKSNKGRRAL